MFFSILTQSLMLETQTMRIEMYFFLFRPPLEAHEDELLAGLLWSDPILKDGISPSTRGIGVFFGPDVTKNFLG